MAFTVAAEELATDVLVLGGGNAALAAALAARRRGVEVLVAEAAPPHLRGGNSRHTRDVRIAHAGPDAYVYDRYDEDEFWQDLVQVSGPDTPEHLGRLVIRGSLELPMWLAEQGVRFQRPLKGTLHMNRTNLFLLGGGRAMMNAYYATAERLGVRVLYEAEVHDLDIEDGVFRAAHVCHQGLSLRIRAKAVVAAAGGFEADVEWLKRYWGAAADRFVIRGSPYNTGKVLKALFAHGAQAVGDPGQFHAVAVDARAPRFDGGIVTRLDSLPFGIVVNKDAERFHDEGEDFWPKRYATWGRLIAQQPEQVAYSITDAKVQEAFLPSVYPAVRADSLAELALRLGLSPDALQATVQRYNAAVRPGTFDPAALDDCRTEGITPAKSHWALPVDTPPFFGYPLRPGITFTYLGVAVDATARVLLAGAVPAANVFAAGELMAGNILRRGYLAGIGLTIGAVFGRIAGEEAAAWVRKSS